MINFNISSLNDNQKSAAEYKKSHVCIIAGPGSGKTRVLTSRIILTILNGESPEKILALTFTNKAADEMKERIIPFLSVNNINSTPFIGTFHGWALNFLKIFFPDDTFEIIDDEDAFEIFKDLSENLKIKQKDIKKLFSEIKLIKQKFPYEFPNPEIKETFLSYQNKLRKYKLWDYDDVIIESLILLDDSDVRKKISEKYSHILIDEFQDLSPAQYSLLKKIINNIGLLFVIGDPDQSIYSFRGASPDIFDKIQIDFKDLKILNLEFSYRNPENILRNAFIVVKEQTKTRPMSSSSLKKGEFNIINFTDENEESKWILKKIKDLTGNQHYGLINSYNKSNYEFSQIAVLYRNHVIARKLISEFSRHNIPFQTAQKENNNFSKLLKILIYINNLRKNKENEFYLSALEKLLNKNIKDILQIIDKSLNLDNNEFLESVLSLTNINPDYITKLIIKKFRANKLSIDELALRLKDEIDCFYNESNGISLLTIHSSKGLEFPVVFIIGLEEDLLPLKNSDIMEERRLFYVGITRASEKVFLCVSNKRDLYNSSAISLKRSHFLNSFTVEEKEIKPSSLSSRKPKQKKFF